MEACVGSRWGAIAGDVQDAPGVLARLDQPQIEDLLIGLYCCDAQLCGVDNIALPGYDPNVDLIINVCSSLGYEPIRDPGPPAVTHTCVNTLLPSSDISCSRTTILPTKSSTWSSYQTTRPYYTTSSTRPYYTTSSTTPYYTTSITTTDNTASTSEESTSSTTDTSIASTTTQSVTSTTGSSSGGTTTSAAMTSTSGTSAAPPTISSLEDPWLGENLSGGPNDATGGLSTAAKIIIGAAVGGAILVAIIAVLWHYRYGRKAREAQPPAGDSQPSLVLVPPISPTSPFLTPSPSYLGRDGVPLTPPPRLQERRLLPTGSTEQLIERGPSRLHQGFHLPTASRSGIASPYGSTVSPPLAMNAAAASAALAADRTPPSPHRGRSPYLSPTRSQFASISYASSLADPGPPPSRDLPSTPSRTATTQSGGPSRADISPNAIGVALAFPPREDNISTQVSSESGVLPHEDNVSAQVSNESGESSESKIMTGPMRGTWGDTWGGKGARAEAPPAHLAPQTPTTRTSRSPILQEQELARMAGSY
ncbi:hypothetical protein CCM_05146 [Cordyceps militaris CM01]|uniref:Uncharacterized protein n=1 Tax=Cordyceps militaris (strain CM01) TaxID=983644 RepID=G3JI36_CORMM|nr:uncharacterized protein CCM_05146 [Cordyceps militaris CM01]EGX90989.1 hypothetical protein CCM_05146 [Cordyceps militaris CM01]